MVKSTSIAISSEESYRGCFKGIFARAGSTRRDYFQGILSEMKAEPVSGLRLGSPGLVLRASASIDHKVDDIHAALPLIRNVP